VSVKKRCSECAGRGWTTSGYDLPAIDREVCERCNGSGYLIVTPSGIVAPSPGRAEWP
jgi:DnaJ-class molecular chaperone